MKLLLIGHRGVGKTSLLHRLKEHVNNCKFFDLDAEIENLQGCSVSEIFAEKGETHFRQLEEEVLFQLDEKNDNYIIALGAGYCAVTPKGSEVLWLQRVTDSQGRIFLNRPSLNSDLSPLQEYLQRFTDRQSRYLKMSNYQFILPEGDGYCLDALLCYLGLKNINTKKAVMTITPWHTKKHKNYFQRLILMGIGLFELRDDLLTLQQIKSLPIDESNRLYSYRQSTSGFTGENVDWALELGEEIHASANIISLHTRKQELLQTLQYLNQFSSRGHLKLACCIENFQELLLAHSWWLEDPENRSFLPRSENAKYQWYRQLFGPRMKLNFIREGQGSALDQPSFYQFVNTSFEEHFGAVLGSPVAHSRTPIEQAELPIPMVAIDLSEAECDLQGLAQLGMVFAAVTSPLKKHLYAVVNDAAEGSLNTLILKDNSWISANTDVAGLKKVLADVQGESAVLWGGGGTISSVQTHVPEVHCYSARTGAPRKAHTDIDSPEVVIWAVGRSQQVDCKWPPSHWQPKRVIDLNYTENSPGIEYAKKIHADYKSGLEMFEIQARCQRKLFNESRASEAE